MEIGVFIHDAVIIKRGFGAGSIKGAFLFADSGAGNINGNLSLLAAIILAASELFRTINMKKNKI